MEFFKFNVHATKARRRKFVERVLRYQGCDMVKKNITAE